MSTQAELVSYGEWQEPVLAIFKLWAVARTGCCYSQVARTSSCHFKNCKNSEHRLYWEFMVSGKNWFLPISSCSEWQEPVLAILKLWGVARTSSCHLKTCRHRLKELVMGSGKNWYLPFKSYMEWQEPVLATLEACRHRLKELVMGSGKNQFLPFESVSTQPERVSYGDWQEPVLAI